MKTTENYRTLLNGEFAARRQRNPGYSLRAFARDLDMPPSKLSEVLRGRCGLSATSARRIASEIRLSEDETQWFVLSVEANHGRSRSARAQASETLKSLTQESTVDELSLERFKIISDWYHFAIMELTETEGFESKARWIAQRLGVDESKIETAIQRLMDFGLLKRSRGGRLQQTLAHLATPNGIPSREIRRHHSQILLKAEQTLEESLVEEREYGNVTMSFSSSQLADVREALNDCRKRIVKIANEPNGKKDRVYSFAYQFFPLDKVLNTNLDNKLDQIKSIKKVRDKQ